MKYYEILAFKLSRIYKYLEDQDIEFCLISACHNYKEASSEQNKAKTIELEKILRSRKYGYVPIRGGYIEEQRDGSKVVVEEDSFLVRKITKDEALEFCKKFDQDAILWKDKDGCRYLDRYGKQLSKNFIGFSQEKEAVKEYFTKIKRGNRKFAFIAEKQENSMCRAYMGKLNEYKIIVWNKSLEQENV